MLQTKQRGPALERHIFFWLGKDSSQDERGVAAYKTVELDESLGGEPTQVSCAGAHHTPPPPPAWVLARAQVYTHALEVDCHPDPRTPGRGARRGPDILALASASSPSAQHREVQGHESGEFQRLFKGNLTYLDGGIDSGFRKVNREAFTTKLFQVKGRRNIQCTQVELSPSAMNVGDVFILDAGRDIYQWNGPEASRLEKQKAMEVTRKIRDEERGGKGRVHIVDPSDDDTEFWQKFGVPKPRSPLAPATDDAAHEKQLKANVQLYHLSDDSGRLVVREIKDRPLKRDFLLPGDAYVLDVGTAGIWAWVGKKASPSERKNAMHYATQFMQKKGYPDWTPITRVAMNAEPPMFKQYFGSWPDRHATGMGGLGVAKRGAARPKKVFDSNTMHTQRREEYVMPDDGKGRVKVWRIEDFDKVPVDPKLYGQFFGGDSYVILYEYEINGRAAAIIYFWQGLKSTQDEIGASALKAKELDDEMGGYPVQVRVVQNKEPPHFCLIFKNRMVVHMGGKASGFKNSEQQDEIDDDGTRLFHIRGTNANNVRAVQVEERAASLNSGDCFILETPKKNFLWFGSGCSKEERDFTLTAFTTIDRMQHLDRDPDVIMEGRETSDFWSALGGKTGYSTATSLTEGAEAREPRLFQCSNNKGYFYSEEIFDFDQTDLIEDDVMLLDAYNEVFVWIGKGANAEERKESMKLSTSYVDGDPSPRKAADTIITVIKQGNEPPNFTCHFLAWDDSKWRAGQTYEQQKAEMQAKNPSAAADLGGSLADQLAKYEPGGMIVPYAVLTGPPGQIPPEVDKTNKEQYLSNEEWDKYMGKPRDQYDAMPAWKKNGIKRKAKLF